MKVFSWRTNTETMSVLFSSKFQRATCLDTTTNDDYRTITTAISDAEFYLSFIILKEDCIIFLSFPYKQTPLE